MKKIIIVLLVIITAIFLWSPWMGEDGGEDIIRKIMQEVDVEVEMQELTDKYSYNPETGDGCDGVSSQWAPFGRTVEYCEFGSWYITFWGLRF